MDDILSQIIAYAPDRIDTETKARAMVQGPRNMYNQGQLVQPNADGSRPGYSGLGKDYKGNAGNRGTMPLKPIKKECDRVNQNKPRTN